MHRRSIHVQSRSSFNNREMLLGYLSGFSFRFQKLSRAHGQVTYVLLTRSPLDRKKQAPFSLVRLACIRHAASVHPEPGSNSPFDLALDVSYWHHFFFFLIVSKLTWIFFSVLVSLYFLFLFSFQRSFRTSLTCSSILPNISYPCNPFFTLFLSFLLYAVTHALK